VSQDETEDTQETPQGTQGLTEEGRASNDPRIRKKPVVELDIQTEYRPLFSDNVAPPVEQLGSRPPRVANDPRGASSAADNDGSSSQESASA
jgi:ribonuclease E